MAGRGHCVDWPTVPPPDAEHTECR